MPVPTPQPTHSNPEKMAGDRALRRQSYGICPLCQRETHLTFHHLIPKALHHRTGYRKNYTKIQLQTGINICRLCHNGLHDLHDEKTLGRQLNTLEQLHSDPAIRKHVAWVAKQHG